MSQRVFGGGGGGIVVELWSAKLMNQFYKDAVLGRLEAQAFETVEPAPVHADAPRALDLETGPVEAQPHPKRELEL